MDMLQSYVLSRSFHSAQVIVSAGSLSVVAGLGMMLSLMEGFRRAYRLPRDDWGFWGRRFGPCCWFHRAGSAGAGHAGGGLRPPD
jgi:hypothetical protein